LLEQRVIAMQRADAQGQVKGSAAVAGIGAALVAAAITVTMTMSNPSPAATPVQAVTPTNQCQTASLMVFVTGSGTVRFREGGYLSPAMTLSSVPQPAVFPRLREKHPIEEVITIEGNATDVMTVSPVTHKQHVYPKVTGVLAVDWKWAPLKPC
jgi:hypothetical protein